MGFGLAVVGARTPRGIQCGDSTNTARGLGSVAPRARSCGPAWAGSSANMGEPWETKREGKRVMAVSFTVDSTVGPFDRGIKQENRHTLFRKVDGWTVSTSS